jgi:HAD superfamily hydrolase (TIGR01490 family)
MRQPLYVFDMDDTLINGDCASLWSQFLVEKGIALDPKFLDNDKALMALYAKGELDMEEYIAYTLAPMVNISIIDVEHLVDEFVKNQVMPLVFPEAIQLIQSLKVNNIQCIIISATVTFIVKKVAQALMIDHALGIDLLIKNGCYLNQVTGVATYREGKVIRLKQWLAEQTILFEGIHFYSDSINDLALCEYADHTYLVNPCIRLRNEAKKHPKWIIYQWG